MTYRLRCLCAAAVAFLVPLAVYVASLERGVNYWDTGELQTVPYILGIAHPSGFPAYVLIGWLWSHVVPIGDPAYRMNVLSAVAMSGAALALAGTLLELAVDPVFACGAALVFAVTRVPWEHATHADVHPLALAAIGTGFWAAARWGRTGSPRALFGSAAAAALSLAVHSGMVLIVPGIALVALGRRPSIRQTAACAALGLVIVAGAYAYLPVRSAVVSAQRLDPTLALGLPPGRPFWDSDHPATWAGFWAEVGGGEFGTMKALARLADPAVIRQLPDRYGKQAVGDLAGGVMLVALIGLGAVLRRTPFAALGIFGGTLLPVLFVLAYPAESDPERYFLPSYWAIGVFLGAGADLLARGGLVRTPRAVTAVVAALLVFCAGSNIYTNRGAFSADDTSAREFIDRIIHNTPPNAVIVTPWMYATPLAYAAYVQKRLGDRIIVTGWPNDYRGYYGRWIAEHRPIVFVTDEPVISVDGLRMREADILAPAPHLFSALAAVP